MQTEIFQAFICYNVTDYGLQINTKLEYCGKLWAIIITIITIKGLEYLTLHVMSLYNILVSPFKLNYWNKRTFAPYCFILCAINRLTALVLIE